MVIVCDPSMFQSIMTETLRGLDVLVYIDDILIIQREGDSIDNHRGKIVQVLEHLEHTGFKASLRKSFLMQKRLNIWAIY